MAAWNLYHPNYHSWALGSKGYFVHTAHIHHKVRSEARIWLFCFAFIATNCRVVTADGNFDAASTKHYPYYLVWVLGSKGHLVHRAPIHQGIRQEVIELGCCELLTQHSVPQRAEKHVVWHGGGMLGSMWDWFPHPFVGRHQQIIKN